MFTRVLATTITATSLYAHTISDYTVNKFCYGNSVNIRSFKLDGKNMQLSVDMTTLKTSIHSPVKTIGSRCDKASYFQGTPYAKLLRKSTSTPYPLQNDGITHTNGGITLTTDLCPSSKKGFERRLYQGIIDKFKNPVPVTLFISGRWILKHRVAFEQFKRWQKNGKLDITWANHTYKHTYHPKKPLAQNFVLSKGYNLKKDILNLEKLLILNSITPSIFFRFPGLVSDKKSIDTVKKLGLITIGSNTWLAKAQKIKNNSIILVHGNKNEPKGVDIFLKEISKNAIKKLTPLSKSLR